MACGTIATLAGLGTSLAGTGLSLSAANSEKQAENNAVGAAINRNQQFVNSARNALGQNISQQTPQAAQQQMNQGTQQLLGYNQAGMLPSATLSMPQNNLPTNPGNAASATAQQGLNRSSNLANANLRGGYSNFALQSYLNNLAANRQIGLASNQAQGWQNILPYQLQAASQSQQGMADAGSLLSTIGSLAGLYGLTSAPATATRYGFQTLPGLWDTAPNVAGNLA